MEIKDAEFVIVDLETTGMRADQDRILEIGAVKVRAGQVQDTFEQLVDPECTVTRRISQITGIQPTDAFGQPKISEVLPDFVEFLGAAVFVAHNSKFDWKFIKAELRRADLPMLKNRTLCTVRLARRILTGLPSKSLRSLVKYFHIQDHHAHRGLSDALATQQVLTRLLDRLKNEHKITELEDVLHFQNAHYVRNAAGWKRLEHIRENYLNKLPESPGVYRMLKKDGKLLYIGKAGVLRDRVRSYFVGIESRAKHIRAMTLQVYGIEWEETATELEALLLESRSIKEHVPPFNKAAKEYRNRPFLRLGEISNSGWITLIEHVRADGSKHYGPMGSRKEAIHLTEMLVFLYGESPDSFQTQARLGVGLESSRIGGRLTEEGFQCANALLEGRDSDVMATLKSRMIQASESQEYECAAKIRDWLEVMNAIHSRPHFFRIPLLERTGAVIYMFDGKIEIHFMAYGIPIAHTVWPCDQNIFKKVKSSFHKETLHQPSRLTMQQVDAISVLAAWMFKQRNRITVLPLTASGSPAEFDAALGKMIDQAHAKHQH